jgi:hypothetical protein
MFASHRKGSKVGTLDQPAATVHPGAVRAIFDHLLLSLTADGEPGPLVFLFSHYRFRWADDGFVGELVFIEVDRGGGVERLVLTDAPALAVKQAGRLSPRGWAERDVDRPPTLATFRSTPLAGPAVSETVIASGLRIDVEWSDLALPTFAMGPAPRVPTEDIVSVLIEASAGRATVNGQAVAGHLFRNDVWVPWLGRPLRSGVVAIGEVLLDRP